MTRPVATATDTATSAGHDLTARSAAPSPGPRPTPVPAPGQRPGPGLPHATAPPHPFPTSPLASRDGALAMLAVTVTAAIAVAAYGRGQLLLTWDEPVQQFALDLRSPLVDRFFLAVTLLGGTSALLPLAAAGAAVTWNRCRAVALALLVATAGRFVVELGLKLVIGRQRPDFSPLADYGGFAFPSGHVLGAVAFWGFLPVIVSVLTGRTWLRRAANVAAVAVILMVAASRVYLGAHWFSDIVAGLAIGAVLLVAAEALLDHLHPRRGCGPDAGEGPLPVSPR